MTEVVGLREWQTAGPTDHGALARRFAFSAQDSELIAELERSRRLEILEVRGGLRITTTSFVGVVHLGPITLQVRPKLAELSPAAMTTILRYALGLDAVSRWDSEAAAPAEPGEFADLLVQILIGEVDHLHRAGLHRAYEMTAEWRTSPRGRFDLLELSRNPLRGDTSCAIPCRISEHTSEIALNQLVLAALIAARACVTDCDTAYQLDGRCAVLAAHCRPATLTRSLWEDAAAAMDHRTSHYQPILKIADLLLNGAGASLDGTGSVAPLSSFLVDMNLVFERLVCRLLCDFGPTGARVGIQVSRVGSFRWTENPHGWQRPRLRPDIVLYDRATHQPSMILDAKYKPLGVGKRPSSEDLYQLTLYSLSFGERSHVPARIIFPEISSRSPGPDPQIEFIGSSGKSAMASVGFVGLPMLRVAEALQRNDTAHLRRIVNSMVQAAPAYDRPLET